MRRDGDMSEVHGWGRALSSFSDVNEVSDIEALRQILLGEQSKTLRSRGVTMRGLGRSYGDAALNSGGVVAVCAPDLHSHPGRPLVEIDSSSGRAFISAGSSIEQFLRVCVPQGFFVPVTPGTRHVSVGGAIAADIHGKNHHCDGTFGNHVSSMTVLLSNGETVALDPVSTPDWFWATVGGMGLTGVVIDATIDLIPIRSNLIEVTTQRTAHIDDLFSIMSDVESDDQFRYSVAWVDMLAKGTSFGRGVLTRGNHVTADDDIVSTNTSSLLYDPNTRLSVPRGIPNGVLNTATIKVFNEMWYRKAPTSATVTHESITSFFHPLDGVRHWNRMYGSRGFLQYQCVVPLGAQEALKEVIAKMQQAKLPAFLAVLKRMGPSNNGLLSFPLEGWTLAVDIAVGSSMLASVLFEIDMLVLAAGGRHYLAKDAHMAPASVERGYPELQKWRSVQQEMDPLGIWTSDLARRLQLLEVGK